MSATNPERPTPITDASIVPWRDESDPRHKGPFWAAVSRDIERRLAGCADREAAYNDPAAIVAHDSAGNAWPGYYVPLEQKTHLERRLESSERARAGLLARMSGGRIVCIDTDGRQYAGPFADEGAARAWLGIQPNRDSLRLVRVVEIPLDQQKGDCDLCHGLGMLPGREEDSDVMNTPCWKCNPHAKLCGNCAHRGEIFDLSALGPHLHCNHPVLKVRDSPPYNAGWGTLRDARETCEHWSAAEPVRNTPEKP